MTAKDVSARRRRYVVALRLVAILAVAASEASAAPMVLEAENGTLTGNAYVSTAVSGYSGTGYVTGLQSANDTINWSFTGTPGLYDLVIRFRSPFGQKGFAGSINGHGFSGMFPSNSAFASFDAGLVEVLTGANTLQIGGGWNWYEIDRVDLNPVPTPTPPAPVPATLVDTQATFAARMLMKALCRTTANTPGPVSTMRPRSAISRGRPDANHRLWKAI